MKYRFSSYQENYIHLRVSVSKLINDPTYQSSFAEINKSKYSDSVNDRDFFFFEFQRVYCPKVAYHMVIIEIFEVKSI